MSARRLPPPAQTALDVIALMGTRLLPWHEFELRMHERGCDSRTCLAAVASLKRRKWASRNGGMLEVSDDGYAAAVRGVRPPQGTAASARKRPTRPTHRRLPQNLFG